MKIKSSILTTIALCLALVCGCGGGSDGDASGSGIYGPVTMQLLHGTTPIIKAVTDSAVELNLLVDTGATRTLLSRELFSLSRVSLESLCFQNGLCIYDTTFRTADSAFTQADPGYINGIIGVDLLRRYSLTFDYRNALLYFDTIPPDNTALQSVLPLDLKNGRPFGTVFIENQTYTDVLLDTGAAFTRITAQIRAAHPLPLPVLYETLTFNFNATENVAYVRLPSYCLETHCAEALIAQVGSWAAVGGSFFRQFMTTFDFRRHELALTPYVDTSHLSPSGLFRVGIQIDIFDASTIVHIVENSPAAQSGVQSGSQLLSINAQSAAELGYLGVYALFQDPATTVFEIEIRNLDGLTERVMISP